MRPPVVGALVLVRLLVAAADIEPPADCPAPACGTPVWPGVCGGADAVLPVMAPVFVTPDCCEKVLSAATIARSVTASLVASAFFSGTTQILPLLAVGVSRRVTRLRIWRIFSGLDDLIRIELLRGSAITTVLPPLSAGFAVVSTTLFRILATSIATP